MSLSIVMGSDHAGFNHKEAIKAMLSDAGFDIHDVGTHSTESTDYPDFVHPACEMIESGTCDLGILVCGSANGVAMTANKHQDIRAAICWNTELAELARQHNNANMICLAERFIPLEDAKSIVNSFLEAQFEGGRHERRVNKIKLT